EGLVQALEQEAVAPGDRVGAEPTVGRVKPVDRPFDGDPQIPSDLVGDDQVPHSVQDLPLDLNVNACSDGVAVEYVVPAAKLYEGSPGTRVGGLQGKDQRDYG